LSPIMTWPAHNAATARVGQDLLQDLALVGLRAGQREPDR
jgi:hypothetical protein